MGAKLKTFKVFSYNFILNPIRNVNHKSNISSWNKSYATFTILFLEKFSQMPYLNNSLSILASMNSNTKGCLLHLPNPFSIQNGGAIYRPFPQKESIYISVKPEMAFFFAFRIRWKTITLAGYTYRFWKWLVVKWKSDIFQP